MSPCCAPLKSPALFLESPPALPFSTLPGGRSDSGVLCLSGPWSAEPRLGTCSGWQPGATSGPTCPLHFAVSCCFPAWDGPHFFHLLTALYSLLCSCCSLASYFKTLFQKPQPSSLFFTVSELTRIARLVRETAALCLSTCSHPEIIIFRSADSWNLPSLCLRNILVFLIDFSV